MTRFPKHCPRCGSTELRDIMYGDPDDDELRDLWAHGDVMIRERRTTDWESPGWMCAECGLETADIKTPRPMPANWRGAC